MYTVLRIAGVTEQLEKLLELFEKTHHELSPEINREMIWFAICH